MHAFRPAIRDAIRERRAARLAQLEELRPDSAREWLTFYPFSRAMAGNYYASNLRLFPADELFLYRDIVEVGRTAPLLPKLTDRLAVPAFSVVCGPLADIETRTRPFPPIAAGGARACGYGCAIWDAGCGAPHRRRLKASRGSLTNPG